MGHLGPESACLDVSMTYIVVVDSGIAASLPGRIGRQ